MRNCVDIIRPFTEAIDGVDKIQVIGGVGSAALTNVETVIVPDERWVIAPKDLYLPQYRDDGNLRDFDALVMSTDAEVIKEVGDMAQEIIGDELELSFFGLKPIARLEAQRLSPLKSALTQFVSDRYVLESWKEGIVIANKALFPFEVRADLETLDTWQLSIGEDDRYPMPIPHPGTTILNYLTRSVSGLRPKDKTKVHDLADNIIAKAPETRDWIMDGPGRSQIELAGILHRLRSRSRADKTVDVGSRLSFQTPEGKLHEHPAFMIPNKPTVTQLGVMALTFAKAKGLYALESNPAVVTLWQRLGEKHAGKIIHND